MIPLNCEPSPKEILSVHESSCACVSVPSNQITDASSSGIDTGAVRIGASSSGGMTLME